MTLTITTLFTACDGCNENPHPPVGTRSIPDDRYEGDIPTALHSTLTFAVLERIAEEVYVMDITLEEGEHVLSCQIFRNKNDVVFIFEGIPALMIFNGNKYEFDRSNQTARRVPISAAEIEEEMETHFGDFDKLINLHDAELISTGTATFRGRDGVFYEEFATREGLVQQAFFNDDDEMIGITIPRDTGVNPPMMQMKYHVEFDVPFDFVFDVMGFGYTLVN
jgi:hypothetical protein